MKTFLRLGSVVCALSLSLMACHAAKPAEAPDGVSAEPPLTSVRRTLLERRPATDVGGWETRLYLIEYPPGAAAPLHTHSFDGVGYVLEGRFESAFGDEPITMGNAGQGFVERAGSVHRVFRNPSTDRPLRFLVAFTLRPNDEPFYLGPPHPPNAAR